MKEKNNKEFLKATGQARLIPKPILTKPIVFKTENNPTEKPKGK